MHRLEVSFGVQPHCFWGLFVMQWDAKVLIEDLRASWISPYWLLPFLTTTPVLVLEVTDDDLERI